MMGRIGRSAIRTLSFLRKEIVEIVRQPRLVLTLIVGPFLILLIFGSGLRETDPPLRTVFVAPDDSELAAEVAEFAEQQRERLIVEGVVRDDTEALRRLRAGQLDLVIVFPEDAAETVRDDEHAMITIYHDQIDPLETQAVALYMQSAVDEVNQQVLATFVAESQEDSETMGTRVSDARERVAAMRQARQRGDDTNADAQEDLLRQDLAGIAMVLGPASALVGSLGGSEGDSEDDSMQTLLASLDERVNDDSQSAEQTTDDDELAELESDLALLDERLTEFESLSPNTLVSPFQGQSQRIGGGLVNFTDFYAPAVVVVLLQHLVVTFIALSIVREDALGTVELFRVAPITTSETVVGKGVAYMLIGGTIAATLVALLVWGLGVPMQGAWADLAVSLLVVLVTSVAAGFVLALLADTDSQAVQYAMMLLLATIFFSGFLLSLDRFLPAVRWVAWLLPSTYGVELARTVMLRGGPLDPMLVAAPAAMAAALFAVAWLLMRRRVRPA